MKKNLPVLLVVLIILLVILGVAGFLAGRGFVSSDLLRTNPSEKDSSENPNLPLFEPLEKNDSAPEELNDSAVNELDAVFRDVETSDESLSGLDWGE